MKETRLGVLGTCLLGAFTTNGAKRAHNKDVFGPSSTKVFTSCRFEKKQSSWLHPIF